MDEGGQARKGMAYGSGLARGRELVIPNPILKLMDHRRGWTVDRPGHLGSATTLIRPLRCLDRSGQDGVGGDS